MNKCKALEISLAITCALSVQCAIGAETSQVSSVRKTGIPESELQSLATADSDVRYAGMLHSVAMATSDVELRQKYLKAAAACLIACNKEKAYAKHIKGKLQNAANVERELKGDCKKCSGSGLKKRWCTSCSGSGQCPGCKGAGEFMSVGFDGRTGSRPCRKCHGRRDCHTCRGEGAIKEKCLECTGSGKVFSKMAAECVFRDICNALVKDAERARLEAESRKEREKMEAKARKEREWREAKEREEREKADAKARKERERMEALGLVSVYGKWMTPGSERVVRYRVFQIYESGHALCNDGTGRLFCLLYSADDNQDLSEGDVLVNDLYRCGTFSYIDVNNARRVVAQFAIDLHVALKEIRKRDAKMRMWKE